MILRTMNERYKNINQLRFVYRNANDVCILDTFDILIIIMVVLKMLCDQNELHLIHHIYTAEHQRVLHKTINVRLVAALELLVVTHDLPWQMEFGQLKCLFI